MMNPWTLLDCEERYANPWIRLEHCRVLKPNGAPGVYGIVRFQKLAVGALPVHADGAVTLVGQWRVPLSAYSWEMPEGGAEPGEAPDACAARELEEEAGLVAGHLQEVLRMHLSNSVTDEAAVCYLATDLRPGRAAPDETEVLQQRRVPFMEALAEALDGRITDSLTVATLLRVHHMATTGALPAELARVVLGR